MNFFDLHVLAFPTMRKARGFLAGMAILDALLVVVEALFLARALSNLWAGEPLQGQVLLIGVFVASFVLRQVVVAFRQRVMEKKAQECSNALLQELVDVAYCEGPAYVQKFGSAKIINGTVEGISRVTAYLEATLVKSMDLMVIPTVLVIALFALDWISGLIALIMLPCIMVFMRLLGANSKQAAAAQHGTYERLSNHFSDTLRGFSTVKLFGRSRAYDKQIYESSEKLRAATIKTLRTVTLSSLILDLFRTFTLAAVAIMLGFRLMDGSIELFPALAALVIVPEYFGAIRRYSTDFHATLEGRNQMNAFAEMLQAGGSELLGAADVKAEEGTMRAEDGIQESTDGSPETEDDVAQADSGTKGLSKGALCTDAGELRVGAGELAQDGDKGLLDGSTWDAQSTLKLHNLGFAYMQEDHQQRYVLSEVSFEAQGFAKVGIVGASGAGKTTLASLLAGFASPSQGYFEINGMPCNTLAQDPWRRLVAYIPQNPYIFTDTLGNNITFYCPSASEESLHQAVLAAGLAELVDQLPQGLNTLVGQGQRQLSGGQAQRVALARALLDENRHIWLLDEPTAHLDIETELALKERMLPLMEGHLVLLATHRLHWMKDMDLLVVLDKGHMVQIGSYDELLADEKGAFYQLVQALRGGYR